MTISTNGHNGHVDITQEPVLVLNQNYEPLNVCTLKRAVVLVFSEKAEILDAYDAQLHSTSNSYDAPSVIRLYRMILKPRARVKLSRREVFERDGHICQYCGKRGGDLTIDHIIPRSRGGKHTWENVVTACRSCNHRKGGRSAQEAHMQLLSEPHEPSAGRYYSIERRISNGQLDHWLPFLPGIELTVADPVSSTND